MVDISLTLKSGSCKLHDYWDWQFSLIPCIAILGVADDQGNFVQSLSNFACIAALTVSLSLAFRQVNRSAVRLTGQTAHGEQ